MVQVHLTYEGGLRVRAAHAPSRSELQTDAPVDNHGRGETFSPTDLLATSLGACMLTILGIYADREELDLNGSSAHVIKHMVADPRRRVGRLEVSLTLPASIPERHRGPLQNAARSCPVALSLGESLQIDLGLEFTDLQSE